MVIFFRYKSLHPIDPLVEIHVYMFVDQLRWSTVELFISKSQSHYNKQKMDIHIQAILGQKGHFAGYYFRVKGLGFLHPSAP